MTGTRERHRVIVYGERPNPLTNSEYYATIPDTAKEVADERGEVMALYPNMKGKDNNLGEVVVPTKEFAEELKSRLDKKGLFEKVEIDSQTVKKIFK